LLLVLRGELPEWGKGRGEGRWGREVRGDHLYDLQNENIVYTTLIQDFKLSNIL